MYIIKVNIYSSKVNFELTLSEWTEARLVHMQLVEQLANGWELTNELNHMDMRHNLYEEGSICLNGVEREKKS